MVAGIQDLEGILASLDVLVRPGPYVFAVVPRDSSVLAKAAAIVTEDEGLTAVLTVADAQRAGLAVEPAFAWLTITVHSSLEAVGLTAVLSTALAEVGLSCNVIAGYYHDHLLVPFGEHHRAMEILRRVRRAD